MTLQLTTLLTVVKIVVRQFNWKPGTSLKSHDFNNIRGTVQTSRWELI